MELPAVQILLVEQGDRPVEHLANLVHYEDHFLVYFFISGLKSALKEQIPPAGPRWMLCNFVEVALKLCFSPFTVGVEDMESPVPSINFTFTRTTTYTQASFSCTEVPTHPAFIFGYSLVFLISLVLNCITTRVYFCTNQHVKSSVTVYLKNLAAADFFLCLCLALRIANNTNYSMTICKIYCSFGAAAFYLNMYASILFMDFIAANRYLKIVRPLETHVLQTVRITHHISIATWLSLLSISSIYLILFFQTSWDHDQRPVGKACCSCESMHSPYLSMAYKIIHCVSFVAFIFVLMSLIFLYWKTLQTIRQAQLSTQALGLSSSPKFNKSKRNMLVLVGVFSVCFVPYHLVRLTCMFTGDCEDKALGILKELTVLLSVLNVCFDPLIYFFFCKAFRAKLSLRKKKELQRSSENQGRGCSKLI
ncbi:P2Y purinoceptor 14-like [Xyrauchen texanus]|uniref:P2Y purinoceptor 14-like n=1 Tax=Xyrauchen texanus TaxID=154827 RepID=UPI002241882D|nr:P2Y purinoceptor 14-like [Xyrauchen texanus]